MPYCSVDDIKARVPEAILIGLTQDDSSATSVDETKISDAIGDGDGLIDFYLASQYEVPFSPVPAIIKNISISIARYNLYKRKYDVEFPEAIQRSYEEATELLRTIRDGEIEIVGATRQDDASRDFIVATNIEEEDIVYNDDKLAEI